MNTEKLPKVAVLLAAYNGMKWIEEQIDSILKQQGVVITLFVSVDRSTDGTEECIQLLQNRHANVVMLPYGERFGGAGPNFFRLIRDVDFTKFDYIALSDQDDIWLDNKLYRATSVLSENKFDVYSSDVIAFWPNGRELLIKKSYPQRKFDHFFESPGPGCTYVLNLKSATYLKENVIYAGDDVDRFATNHDCFIYALLRQKGFYWHIDNEPLMLYRQHANNQVGTNTGYAAYKKRLALVRSHWYKNQVKSMLFFTSDYDVDKFTSYHFLLFNYNNLRRRPRDRYALLLMLFLNIF